MKPSVRATLIQQRSDPSRPVIATQPTQTGTIPYRSFDLLRIVAMLAVVTSIASPSQR